VRPGVTPSDQARSVRASEAGPIAAPAPIAAIILTHNEEDNLGPCLASLAGWIGELFVVDSGSTDATRAIAERHGARALDHSFETHARQWLWALGHVPFGHEWVLALDADQRVTPELREEIVTLFAGGGAALDGVHGLYLNRRQIFRGRWIRHGGYYPKHLLKLFRRGQVRIDEGDLIDHHFYVTGPTRVLRHDLVEDNAKERDIGFWTDKHNRYATLQARVELSRRGHAPVAARLWGTPDERTAWMKRLWDRLPLYVRPFLYFVYRYVLRFGFLDGKEGFVFHFLQAFWYRLLVDIKLDELRKRGH
jgi:glycosyltransferase involved in cell wall biosynthesis